jgi:hypothetical protein
MTATYGRMLLDAPDGHRDFDRRLLERLEHPVDVCGGPEPAALCPLLKGEGCERFEGAHGVVFKLDLDRAQHRAILARYRQLAPDGMPIRVTCSPDQALRYDRLLDGFEVWDHDPTVADLDAFASEVEASDR